jgi:hypothetical protein
MKLSGMVETLTRFLFSPANWVGLTFSLATVALILIGYVSARWLGIAALAYGVGFITGGMWFGWPQLKGPAWDELTFAENDTSRDAPTRALAGIRRLVSGNPGRRLSAMTGAQLLKLCDDIEAMLGQWERSKAQLSIEDSFHARYIALRYLPDALKRFWSIPAQFATTRQLDNGLTADATLGKTVDELGQKVRQLNDALAAHDAQAFLDHSRFLSDKFGAKATQEAAGPVALK